MKFTKLSAKEMIFNKPVFREVVMEQNLQNDDQANLKIEP